MIEERKTLEELHAMCGGPTWGIRRADVPRKRKVPVVDVERFAADVRAGINPLAGVTLSDAVRAKYRAAPPASDADMARAQEHRRA